MRTIIIIPLSLMLFSILSSCQSSKLLHQSDLSSSNNAQEQLTEPNTTDRKVLFSADLTLLVATPDTASLQIQQIAKQFGGYINEISNQRSVISVKSDQLDAAIEAVSRLGKIQKKNIIGIDVTEAYFDFKVRLDNAMKARDRYLELLAQAENVEAALKVERELERLNEVIDVITGKINRIDQLESFSTITIYLKEQKKPGILGYVGLGLYKAVKWLFVSN